MSTPAIPATPATETTPAQAEYLGRFPCGHHGHYINRKAGMFQATACGLCAGPCPRCHSQTGHYCNSGTGWGAVTHAARYKAHGIEFTLLIADDS